MKYLVYAIRDAKTESFGNPIVQITEGEAARNFEKGVNDDRTTMFQFPEDFDLYYLGTYETNDGKISPLPTPEHKFKAINMKKLPENQATT